MESVRVSPGGGERPSDLLSRCRGSSLGSVQVSPGGGEGPSDILSNYSAIVSEELDEGLNKYFYKVVCSSKSAQGVGVTRELVLLSVSPFFPAAWAMFRMRQGVGMNYFIGKLRWLM